MSRTEPSITGATELADLEHDLPFLRRLGILPAVAQCWGVGLCRAQAPAQLSQRIVFPVRIACGQLVGYSALDPSRAQDDPELWVLTPGLYANQHLFGIERVSADPRVAELALRDGLSIVATPLEVLRAVQRMRLPVVSPIVPRDFDRVRILESMRGRFTPSVDLNG